MAPPISPAATPAATPSPAFAGGVTDTSDPAMVVTATRAAIVLFMSCCLLEVAFSNDAGWVMTEHADTRLVVSLPKRRNGQPEVNAATMGPEKAVFFRARPGTRSAVPGRRCRFSLI